MRFPKRPIAIAKGDDRSLLGQAVRFVGGVIAAWFILFIFDMILDHIHFSERWSRKRETIRNWALNKRKMRLQKNN